MKKVKVRELVFATNNKHKISEVVAALKGGDFLVRTLADCGIDDEIAETADTLEGNAELKARFVAEKLREMGRSVAVFADDTGLEIEALGGEPGVRSARYSGKGPAGNIKLVLSKMAGETNRAASFRTVICLITEDGETQFFEGCVDGFILTERHGRRGFGYDPIFRPQGYALSFGEMPSERKTFISHRGLAVTAMADFLTDAF